MRGHFELSTASASLHHDFKLFKLPILGFSVPILGAVGMYIQVDVPVALDVDDAVEIDFGFDFSVPNGANVRVMLDHIDDSEIHGFAPSEGLQLTAMPIKTNVSGLDLTLSAALRMQVLFGYTFLDNKVQANAGVFLELPSISVSETQLSDVDGNCQAASSAPMIPLIGNATEIVPSIGVSIGVDTQTGLKKAKRFSYSNDSLTTTKTLAAYTYALPSTCIHNGGKTKVLPAPTRAISQTAEAGTALLPMSMPHNTRSGLLSTAPTLSAPLIRPTATTVAAYTLTSTPYLTTSATIAVYTGGTIRSHEVEAAGIIGTLLSCLLINF